MQLIDRNDPHKPRQTLHRLNLHIILHILQQRTERLHQTQISNFLPETLSNVTEVFTQSQSNPPGFVLGGLDDDW